MLLVEVVVDPKSTLIEQSFAQHGEDAVRDRLAMAVYRAVADCGEDTLDTSVMWSTKGTEPLDIAMTVGSWQPENPKLLWKQVRAQVATELAYLATPEDLVVAGRGELTLF